MLRYVIAIACVVGVSAKCAKSCQKYDCDYWVDELMMDCKSLEKEYQCDCGGCHCSEFSNALGLVPLSSFENNMKYSINKLLSVYFAYLLAFQCAKRD